MSIPVDEFEGWLRASPEILGSVTRPIPVFEERVAAMQLFMGQLFEAGWNRYGWPEEFGGLGGSVLDRAAMWETLARFGVPTMAVFEHFEVLAPTLVALGPPAFVTAALPAFLSGRELWCQGFSEPDSGSDLPSLRTTARAVDGGFVVNGHKIWTSWAKYARWCLCLTRTGTPESRHRGLTALIIDMRADGVEPRAIEQANGTDELAEVFFDDVFVPADRVVGEVDGGWAVATHILSHERGTFCWFRHAFLYQYLRDGMDFATEANDAAIGNALLDLIAASATGYDGVLAHSTGVPLGQLASYPKLMLCNAEQSVCDATLGFDADLPLDVFDDHVALRRQEYLFSRIVTVYGGSQQMQLDTIAKQIVPVR
jgi:alkylation response protein AidB-like acyl-CoA dehydrogenase